MKGQVLLLNASYDVLRVIPMERAIAIMLREDNRGRIEKDTGRVLHSAGGLKLREPSVLVLSEYRDVKGNIRKANIQKLRVFTRDKFTCQYCVSPETPVLTAHLEWIQAEDVCSGHKLVGVDEFADIKGQQRKLREAVVKQVTHFDGPRISVNTSQGSIIVSPDHKFLTVGRHGILTWTKADSLVSGTVIKKTNGYWSNLSDTWLAGMFDGEGSLYAEQAQLSISQNSGPVLERLEAELSIYNIPYIKRLVNKEKSTKCYVLTISHRDDLLRLLGMLRPVRLLPQVEQLLTGKFGLATKQDAVFQSIEVLPDGPLVGITTSTGTLITDGFISHNCGKKPGIEKLTRDHIMPESRGGATSPENLVTSCKPCNNRKANRTPEEAGMKLLRPVRVPNISSNRVLWHFWAEKHPEWEPYLFLDSNGDPRAQHEDKGTEQIKKAMEEKV